MHYAKTKRRRKVQGARGASAEGPTRDSASNDPHHDAVQGEGNYEAARQFNAAQQQFVQSGKVEKAARATRPRTMRSAGNCSRRSRKREAARRKIIRRRRKHVRPAPTLREASLRRFGSEAQLGACDSTRLACANE
jgi:hypothetical protein